MKYYGRLLLMGACISVVCLSTLSCYPHFDYQQQIGPQVRTNLLIFFKVDATHQQIEDMWNQVLATPDDQGGFKLLSGVCGIAKSETVQRHESIAVDYCPNVTEAEREAVKARIHTAPIVFKVLEDVIPAQAKSVE